MIISILKAAKISIPTGATAFHTEASEIVFHVNDWSVDDKYFQGQWHAEKASMTNAQFDKLRASNLLGTFGTDLRVADARGYQA